MTFYTLGTKMEPINGHVWSCGLEGCESKMLVPADRAMKDVAADLGWKVFRTSQRYLPLRNIQTHVVCHFHEDSEVEL